MLRHSDIWDAIERLARRHDLSPSGLAKRAGLDATTFNKSKRITRDGKQRWPSTESVAKVKFAGQSRMEVEYEYETINNRAVTTEAPAVLARLGSASSGR